MAQATRSLDDTSPSVVMKDIAGGMNTQDGILDLASNETFSCQNVIGFPNRTLYIGGFFLYAEALATAPADGNWQFYDINDAKHIVVWRAGNMYDVVNGVVSTIATGVYTAGENIGRIDQDGILYWCTNSVTLQQFDGATNTPIVTSGAMGSIAIPSGTYLCSYAGSIVVGNPTISGVSYPGSFIPSNVNDPSTFIGTNLTATGANNFIQAMVPMGVAAGGVPPTNSIMIVGSQFLILAQGPINALKLNSVNIPEGCQDGNSVQYIPTGDLLGSVIYLGNDNQFWETNGITGDCISKKLLDYLNLKIQSSKEANLLQRFSAGYNKRYQYYICDLGQDQQMVYRWQFKAWYFVNGWPSGIYCNGTTGIGFPCNYVSSQNAPYGTFQVGQDNSTFNGVLPEIFYNTAYMHGNDQGLMKEWQWIELSMNNNIPAAYQLTATGLPYAQLPAPVSNTLVFSNPAAIAMQSSNYGIWDVSLWDQAIWAPGQTTAPQIPYTVQGMLVQPVEEDIWTPPGSTQPLRSPAVSFKISWTANGVENAVPSFDMLGSQSKYKPMGSLMVGGEQYSNESGVQGTGYPFE